MKSLASNSDDSGEHRDAVVHADPGSPELVEANAAAALILQESTSSIAFPLPEASENSSSIAVHSSIQELRKLGDASAQLNEFGGSCSCSAINSNSYVDSNDQKDERQLPEPSEATETASEAVTADTFLDNLDDRVFRKLQSVDAGTSVAHSAASTVFSKHSENVLAAAGVSQQEQQQNAPSIAPTTLTTFYTNKTASAVINQSQALGGTNEKVGMAAATLSSTSAAASTEQEGLVPGAYATPGRAPFAHTVMSAGRPSAYYPSDSNVAPASASSVSSSCIDDYTAQTAALELTAVCVDDGALQHQIREQIIQAAPRADAVHATSDDNDSVEGILRKTRRRYALCAGILVVIMGVVVGMSLAGLLQSDSDDSGNGKETEAAMDESVVDDKEDGVDDWLGWTQYKGVLRCGVVGDPSWDAVVNQDFDESNVNDDKGDVRAGENMRRRRLQDTNDLEEQGRGAVDTESGIFRDMPSWKRDKLLDKAATSKEYDICRAATAAVFGDEWKTRLKIVHAWDWHASVYEAKMGLYVGTLSPTIDNDFLVTSSRSGFSFSTPYYYQGLRFAGRPTDVSCAQVLSLRGPTADQTCNSINICARDSSLGLKDNSIYPGLGSVPLTNIVTIGADEDIFGALVNGTCQVVADYGLALVEESARQAGFTEDYYIGSTLVSKEPRVIASYDILPEFNAYLNWILISLFAAVGEGITQANAEEFIETDAFGKEQKYAFINAVKAVGNMEEILARDGINMDNNVLVNDGSSGSIVSHPIGPALYQGQLGKEGTLDEVRTRGRLRCGIESDRPGFAERVDGGSFIGLDVDFCRAVSAAIFPNSPPDDPPIDFIVVGRPSEAWNLLSSAEADIVAGAAWSLRGESHQPVSYSQPYFYLLSDEFSNSRPYLQDNHCLATNRKDPKWRSFVHWVVAATIIAEERGIVQESAHAMPTIELFGSDLDIMFQSVIGSVGNYGEIYSRNLESLVPRSGRNMLNRNPQDSIQGPPTYIPPFM